MHKPIIVITHERSGTHLLINCINFDKNGNFLTIGYTPDKENFNLKNYKHITYKDVMSNAYIPNSVSKSHHQVEFMDEYLNFLFSNYKVIYVKRNLCDILASYYKFIPKPDQEDFLSIEDWVFSDPDEIARKFLQPYFPDPHIIIKPENYIHRWVMHTNGWLKHKDKMLVVDYENILTNYSLEKDKIENYICKKISDKIPNVHDKTLPNFGPVKGVIGGHKEVMSKELIDKINNLVLTYSQK